MKWSRYDGKGIEVRQEKTGALVMDTLSFTIEGSTR